MYQKGSRIWLTFLALIIFTGAALAQNTGRIFTTFGDGTTVNGNIYPSKPAVYLNGGPQNENGKGLPDGIYYFQVTDPNGSVLLSTDNVSCRQLQVSGGIVAGATGPCPHANGAQNTNNGGAIPVQLIPFNDTPNSGGEYKVWITPKADYDTFVSTHTPAPSNNFGFVNSNVKTDNFKVQNAAHVEVCKFNDLSGNSVQDNGEPLIPHWPITATGVAGDSGNGVVAQTDDNGCITFAVSNFTNGVQNITLTETVLTGWVQTSPLDGSCTGVPAANNCTVSGGVITLTVSPNDSVHVPDFGNTCASQACGGSALTVTKTANPSFNRIFKWDISKSVDKTQINTSGDATFNYTVNVTHDSGTDSGWQVTGSIKVSNSTSETISGIAVNDAIDNGGSCSVDTSGFNGTLAPGTHIDLPYVCTYSSAPNPGTNTATATWGVNSEISASGTASVDFVAASINVTDGTVTVTDTFGGALGTATYTDTNPKSFTYSHTFSGDPAGTCTDHNNTATFTTDSTSATGSDSKSVKVCVGADLTVSKTATPAFTSGIQKSVDKTEVDTSSGGNATFTYTVTVTESGWKVSGNITVNNPNDWEDITANLSDVLSDAGGNCTVNGGTTSVVVNRSSSVTAPYTCTFASAPAASGTNTGTATWDKVASFTTDGSASGTASYTFGSLTVNDAFNGGAPVTLGTISTPAATTTFTDPHTVTAPVATCSTLPNTASIVETSQTASQSVKVCGASDLTVSKTAAGTVNSNISKSVDKTEIDTSSGGNATFTYTVTVTESGWKVSGNITVNNPNDWEDITANLSDVLSDAGGSCTVNGGTTSVVVNRSSSVTAPYTCTFASAPAASGSNTGTATWDKAASFTADGSASGTANYSFGALTVTDAFNGGAPVTLGTISTPAATTTFTDPHTVTAPVATCGTLPNTAAIVETSQTASQLVKVCGASNLAVTKTAAGTFNSGISKLVNKNLVEQANSSATFNYTINVTESGWKVAGNITVTNPNDWEAITVTLSDVLSLSGATCTISGGAVQTVPASSSISPAYYCTFSSAPSAATGTNTGIASWNPALAFTSGSSASGTAGFAFGSLTVTDTFNGGSPTTLGTIIIPAALTTFTESRTVPNSTGGQCQSYTNIAAIVGGPTSSQTVTVCNTATGALTMGFWQNKNGQGIITGGASTGGVCNSGTFLRNFAPFQDLSATATCSQVGTYVTKIINAANASGAAMNAMLKAQMLATALDVFFSDPTLGGNKINAPTPIGTVKIDLTQPQNVSSAFGGATSMTVLNLLLFQNTVSNAGGSVWYGQVKSTQELAKNTFDAINNQIALIAP